MKFGPVDIPDNATSSTPFPFTPTRDGAVDWGWIETVEPAIVVHTFESGNRKIEQRYYMGDGARKHQIRMPRLKTSQVDALKAFWEDLGGPYGQFPYVAPNRSGAGGTRSVVCRLGDPTLTFEHLSDAIASVGLTLIEVPSTTPTYDVAAVVDRYPNDDLVAGLAAPAHTLIPLVTIVTAATGTVPSYTLRISDRACNVGVDDHGDPVFYHPRLLDWDGVSQSLGNEADVGKFVFGDADRVFSQVAEAAELWHAPLLFSVYHVESQTKIDLWMGEITNFESLAGGTFAVDVADGVYETTLLYPARRASQVCGREFNSPQSGCPWSTTPGHTGDNASCDKGFGSANGCQSHGMSNYFGGIYLQPQPVVVRDNSASGRPKFTSTSVIADSLYHNPVQEVYTDEALAVPCMLVTFREEGDFVAGLGIIGEGPIGSLDPSPQKHLLDGMPPHGPGNYGWRYSLGRNPNPDPFGLGQTGSNGVTTYPGSTKAGGTAFADLRRKDASGMQLSTIQDHDMNVIVTGGLGGWVWDSASDPASRRWQNPLVSGPWILVNMFLRARGMRGNQDSAPDAADQFALFDCQAVIDAAAICGLVVPCIVNSTIAVQTWVLDDDDENNPNKGHWETTIDEITEEPQFRFRGILAEEKALRDWMTEVSMNFLGYFTFRTGKLRVGIRSNASVTQAFGPGNIIADSLTVQAARPTYNHLTVRFGDKENNFQENTVELYDEDYAKRLGGAHGEVELKAQMNLCGTTTKSQAARICIARLREETCGWEESVQRKARKYGFRTTLLGLQTDPGSVCSIDHERAPDGHAKFRALSWKLNKDWSIEVQGRTVADSSYDYVNGPKPPDIHYLPPPVDPSTTPDQVSFKAVVLGDGLVRIRNLVCRQAAALVRQATFEVLYVDLAAGGYCRAYEGIADDTSEGPFGYQGTVPQVGEMVLVDGEAMLVYEVTSAYTPGPGEPWLDTGTFHAHRAQWGTTAAAHPRVNAVLGAVTDNVTVDAGAGNWHLGDPLFIPTTDPAIGDGRFVGSIDGTKLTVERPWDSTASTGQDAYSDPRIYTLQTVSVVVPVAPNFWTSGQAATWEQQITLPNCAVVLVRGRVETMNAKSAYIYRTLGRAMTLGNTRFEFTHDNLLPGVTINAFDEARAPESTAFKRGYAETMNTHALGIGTVTLGGDLDAEAALTVSLGSTALPQLVLAAVPDAPTTIAGAAQALAAFLSLQDAFAARYVVSGVADTTVTISSRWGDSDTISVAVAGAITAAATGVSLVDPIIPAPPAPTVALGRCAPVGQVRLNVGAEAGTSEPTALLPLDLPAAMQINLTVGTGADGTWVCGQPWRLADHPDLTTLADLLASVAAWLNADEVFSAYYRVDVSGDSLWVTDPTGHPGQLACPMAETMGPGGAGIFATVLSDVTNPLGVASPGRRYMCTWAVLRPRVGHGGGTGKSLPLESAPSPLSAYSGPVGSAQWISLQNLATCKVAGVDTLRIYAEVDGGLRLVTAVPNGTNSAADTLTGAALAERPLYAGELQPADYGAAKITVLRDGQPWLQFRTPDGASRSNIVDGWAMGALPVGARLTIDVDNQSYTAKTLRVVLE